MTTGHCVSSSASTLLFVSENCSSRPHLRQIHASLIRHLPTITTTAIIHRILAKLLRFAAVSPHGDLRYAAILFSYHLPHLAVAGANLTFFYNILIRGHSNTLAPSRCFSLFSSMRHRSLPPDPFSFTFLLKARSRCTNSCSDVHGAALKFGCLSCHPCHIHVHNALINVYALNANVSAARQVFDEMSHTDVVSWSGLLTAHLKANELDGAREVFDVMPVHDVVSWTAMISGYSQARRPNDALELFHMMPMFPDEVTMVGVISACTALGDLETGHRIHCYVKEQGFGWMVSLCNALIDMYSKCGNLHKAREVFDDTREKNLVSWNSMISAYGTHGDVNAATNLFQMMVESGNVKPDGVTLLVVLNACAHEGRVEEGRGVFESLRRGEYGGVEAGVEHYGCMVDLLGRAGLLKEAYQLIEGMPILSNDVVWGALLGACRIHGDVEMAEHAITKLMELKPDEGGYHVLLSSLYASDGRLKEAAEIWRSMNKRNVRKNPGCSSWAGASALP